MAFGSMGYGMPGIGMPGQMPQQAPMQVPQGGGGIPFSQNPMITALAASLLGAGGDWRGAGQNFASMAPAAMATNYAMRKDNRETAQQDARRKALNAWLIARSGGKGLSPDDAALFAQYPELGEKYALSQMTPDKVTPYTEVGKAKEDLSKGLITQQQYDKIAGGGPDAASVANITSIRKEFEGRPGVSRYRTAQPILSSMMQSVDDNTAMSDLDFVYGMAKIFDPESVVREGEMVLVKNSQSLPDELIGLINKLNAGEATLQPQARRELVNVSMTRVGEYQKQATEESQFFTGLASRQGIDPQNVVRPLEQMPAWPAGPPAPRPGVAAPVPWTEYFK